MKFEHKLQYSETTKDKAAHRAYLEKPFTPEIPLDSFTQEEIELLKKYGSWLEALDTGKLKWETREQKHFLEVMLEFEEPQNDLERVWLKYSRAMQGVD